VSIFCFYIIEQLIEKAPDTRPVVTAVKMAAKNVGAMTGRHDGP